MHKLNNNSGFYKLYPIITPDGPLFKAFTYFVGPLLFLMDPFLHNLSIYHQNTFCIPNLRL